MYHRRGAEEQRDAPRPLDSSSERQERSAAVGAAGAAGAAWAGSSGGSGGRHTCPIPYWIVISSTS